MTGFEARERAYETRFALKEELRFKIRARRNRLVGLWAAEQLGICGMAADAYAHQLVELMFDAQGTDAVPEHLVKDFASAGKPLTIERARLELERCERDARQQILGQ